MKLTEILYEKELPKKKWVKASKDDLAKYKDDIFQLIQVAYKYIGGHVNFRNPDDVNTLKNKFYEIEDVSGDSEIDAVAVAKKTEHGVKHLATGHDGSKEAKRNI